MAMFSPYPQATNDPSYIGLSKEPGPIAPNKAMGKLFEGMGDMLEMGVKGLDTIHKQNIEDELSSKLESERNAEIYRAENTLKGLNGGGAALTAEGPQGAQAPIPTDATQATPYSSTEARTGGFQVGMRTDSTDSLDAPASSSGPMPGDLSGGLNRLSRMGEANAAGKFSSTSMQMNAQAIVSDLKQRYPGYRADITKVARSLGFGNDGYLADLRTQINQTQAKIDAKETKDQAWENTNRDKIAILDPGYFGQPRDVRRSDDNRDRLQTQIGQFEARTTLNNDVLKGLEVKHKRGEDVKLDVTQAATDTANTFLAATMTGVNNVMGYKNVTDIQKEIASGKSFTPDETTRIAAALEQFKQAHIARVLDYLHNTKMGNTTVAGIMTEDEAQKLARNSANTIDTIQRAVSEKNYTQAGAAAMEAQMRLDRVGLQISKDHPVADRMEVLNKKFGTPVMQNILQLNPTMMAPLTATSNQLITGSTLSIASGSNNPATNKPYTVNDIFNDYKRLGVSSTGPTPNDAAALMGHVRDNILAAPPELGVKFAKAAFTDDLFARVPAKEKLPFLVNYANPQMTAKVLELSKHDPDLLNQYKSFIQNGVLAATSQTVSDFKTVQNSTSTAFNANPYYTMVFDPNTNRINLKTKTSEELYAELGTTPSRYANIRSQLRTVQKTTDDLNKGLNILDPVLKSEKSTISPEMINLLNSAGVKVDIPDTTGSPAADTTEQPRPSAKKKTSKSTPISNSALGFATDDMPSSGNVGALDNFLTNPAGNVAQKTPVMAQGGNKKNTNLTAEDLLSITTDDIPEGMSARDFLKQLKERRP